MDDDYVTTWEVYGLKTDPFSTSPILVKGGLISPKSFIGREDEIRRLEKIFRSSGGSRSIVCGMQGVGKTTLVNMARINALGNQFFTPYQEIKIDFEWGINDFIINSMAAIYSTLIKIPEPSSELSEIRDKLKILFDTYEKRDASYSISTPFGGGGFGGSTTIHNAQINTTWLMETFQELTNSLAESGFREVVLHYNNLDTFDEEEVKMKKLFNRIRDFIQTPKVHFIFVGSPTTSSIIHAIPRVSNIITDTPIHLEPLTLTNVKKLIRARIKSSEIKGVNAFDPVSDEAIEILYELHNGNIRAILNSLSTALREVTEEKPVYLTKDVLCKVLYTTAQRRFSRKITPTMQKVLMEMLMQKESTNKSLVVKLGKQSQNISKYLKILKENQCITLLRTDGREKFYAVAEWVKWLLLKPEGQHQTAVDDFS